MRRLDRIAFVIGAIACGFSFFDPADNQGLVWGILLMIPTVIIRLTKFECIENWCWQHYRLVETTKQIAAFLLWGVALFVIGSMFLGSLKGSPRNAMPLVLLMLLMLFTVIRQRYSILYWWYKRQFFGHKEVSSVCLENGYDSYGREIKAWFGYKTTTKRYTISKKFIHLNPVDATLHLRRLMAEVARLRPDFPQTVHWQMKREGPFQAAFYVNIPWKELSKHRLSALRKLCLRLEEQQFHGCYYFHHKEIYAGELWAVVQDDLLLAFVYREKGRWWYQKDNNYDDYPDDLPTEVKDDFYSYDGVFSDLLTEDMMITKEEWERILETAMQETK